jgi:hypothetical protein
LNELIAQEHLPFRLFNDYPMLPGAHRALSTDMAILHEDKVLVAIEFKYEPSHERNDIPRGQAAWRGDVPAQSILSMSAGRPLEPHT